MAKLVAGATLVMALAGLALPAYAQNGSGQDQRLDRLERQLKEIRSIVFQGRDTGQPVVVKPDGPDPVVQALQGRVDDLDAAFRKTSGQIELGQHDLDQTRTSAAANHDAVVELRAQIQSLSDRLTRLEGGGQAGQPAPAPEVQSAPVADPSSARAPRRAARDDATAHAQAEDQGVLGGPPTDAAATETGAFKQAESLQAAGDYPNATTAWQTFITHYGQGPRGRDARYRLGETLYLQSSYGEAARAYAEALHGWPKTAWAPDATVKLSQSLGQLGRRDEACSVVGEFDTRYAATASVAVKARAKAVHKATCTAG
jgi:tol-pal system protein YbgF